MLLSHEGGRTFLATALGGVFKHHLDLLHGGTKRRFLPAIIADLKPGDTDITHDRVNSCRVNLRGLKQYCGMPKLNNSYEFGDPLPACI